MHHLEKLHPRVVLVLGSGSARGFAHAGILKVLEKHHIPIDMIVGTSAGSIVGALYADNPSASSLEHLLLTTPRNEVIAFSLMSPEEGLVSNNQFQKFLIRNLQASSFEKLTIPFLAVATDLQTGKIHVFGSGPIAPAVNASSAIPPLFRPVKLYGKTYIDGGMVDPVAVDVAQRFHPKIIIAVSLNYPLQKKLSTSTLGVFLRGLDIMMMQLNNYSASNATVVIRPIPSDMNMFDGSKRSELIHAGEVATYKALRDIKRLLIKNHIAFSRIF